MKNCSGRHALGRTVAMQNPDMSAHHWEEYQGYWRTELAHQKENEEGTIQLSGDRSVTENDEDDNTVGNFSIENPTASFFERNEKN